MLARCGYECKGNRETVRRVRNRFAFANVATVTALFVALAGGTAYRTAVAGDPSNTQDGPSADDFSGYIGLAEPGTSMAATAGDRVGDRKAEGLGAVGERTSRTGPLTVTLNAVANDGVR